MSPQESDNSCVVILRSSASRFCMATSPRTLLLPILLLSAAPLVAQDAFPATTLASQDATAYLKPLNKRGVVRLKTIAGDFASHPGAATAKYTGHRITVIGPIASLSKGKSENKVMVVTLQDPKESLPAVKGEFLFGALPPNSELEISEDGSTATLVRRDREGRILERKPYLSVGQIVAIKGDFKEQNVGDIILTGCKLIPKERLHELRNDVSKS